MLAGHHRPLDHQHIQPRLHRDLVIPEDPLRGQRRRHHHLLFLDLADPLGDQLRLHRLAVDLLHFARGELLRQLGDPLQLRVGVLIAGEDPLEVQHR